jgi:hypothetical protein
VGSANNSKNLLKYEKSFVEINVFLILILSNTRCDLSGDLNLAGRGVQYTLTTATKRR